MVAVGCFHIIYTSWERGDRQLLLDMHNSHQKRFPDIFPALGYGVLVWTGIFSSGWGLFSGVPSGEGFWPFEFTGALGFVRGGCAVTLLKLGLASTFTLYFLVGISLFTFSVSLESFLTWKFVLGWVGLNWLDWGWSFGPNFPSNLR